MPLNVCVECGTRVRRLIRKLQFDNYCLEKCVNIELILLLNRKVLKKIYSMNAKMKQINSWSMREI